MWFTPVMRKKRSYSRDEGAKGVSTSHMSLGTWLRSR